jgi:two-component system CheB/CheR fusion protein
MVAQQKAEIGDGRVAVRERFQYAKSYLWALAITLTLFGIAMFFAHWFGDAGVFFWMSLGVVFVARRKGFGPSIFTTVLGGLLVWYFIVPPTRSFSYSSNHDLFRTVLYLVLGSVISLFGGESLRFRIRERQAKEEVEKHLHAVEEREHDHQLVLDAMTDHGIVRLDQNGIIQGWSVGASRLTGWNAKEAIGSHYSLLFVSEDVAAGKPDEELRIANSAGQYVATEGSHASADEGRFAAAYGLTAIHGHKGECLGYTHVFQNITARKRAELDLRGELTLRAMITNNVADALYLMDTEGRVTYSNPAAQKLFGWPTEDMLGKRLHDLIHYKRPDGSDYPMEECPLSKCFLHGETVQNHEDMFIRRDGTFIPVLCSMVPIHQEATISGAVLGVKDMSEKRQAEEALRQAKEMAEAANRGKDQFIAVLSHELRTPLTPVLAAVDGMLRFGNLDEEFRKGMEMVKRNVLLQIALIDDLLDVTRASRGKMKLNYTSVHIHDLLTNVLAICREDVAASGIDVVTEFNAKKLYVRADAFRLQQVFWNLLKNAIKYTTRDKRIIIRTDNDEAGMVRVQVIDFGQGIDRRNLGRVFQAFEQGEQSAGSTHGGLGLGLTIVNQLVEMHAGTVIAHSDGRMMGSTFTVVLPLTDVVPQQPIRRRAKSPFKRAASDAKILLVEDHADTRETMQKMLTLSGYVVETADGVESALTMLEAGTYDLLISDIGLQDGTGHDLMRRLGPNHPKAIALSGFGQEDDISRSRDVGFKRHVLKPVDYDNLMDVISQILSEDTPVSVN